MSDELTSCSDTANARFFGMVADDAFDRKCCIFLKVIEQKNLVKNFRIKVGDCRPEKTFEKAARNYNVILEFCIKSMRNVYML